MICPSKICGKEIPNDSIFCDQCGIRLLQCPKCGTISVSKFCSVCGEQVIERKLTEKPIQQHQQLQPVPEISQAQISNEPITETQGTVIIEESTSLKLIHTSFELSINSGDILGRTTGAHCGKLGTFAVISSKHAKIEQNGNEWFFTDLKSTNKSFINGNVVSPNVLVKLNDNDKLTLANVNFIVSIK